MEDSKIIELYYARDERAIDETKSKYHGYLKTVSGNILKDSEDVAECVSDTYLGAWNAIPPARPNIFRAFLAKIARNLSLKKFRSLTAEKRGGSEVAASFDELSDSIADNKSIDESLEIKELERLIDIFLTGRNANDRKLFVCRYWYMDSIVDIAERFGYTESKVKMSLKRTRDDLRAYLEEKGVLI